MGTWECDRGHTVSGPFCDECKTEKRSTLTSVTHTCSWCGFTETHMVEFSEIEGYPQYWMMLKFEMRECKLCPTCAARFRDLETTRRTMQPPMPGQ
jgi:hypothetical protein